VIAAVPRALRPIPAMEGLVERIVEGGHPTFFLSNMPAPYADYLERKHAVVARFRDGVFSGRVGVIKPDRAIFELATARFGIAGEPTVFIDDVQRNLDAAREHGWRTIHFVDPPRCERGLAALGVLG
jgi:putative hydrolase of the HAD superfamily